MVAMKPATPMKTPMMRMHSWIQLILGGARTLTSDQNQFLGICVSKSQFVSEKDEDCESGKIHLAHRSTLSTLYFWRRLFNSALSSAKIPCTSSRFTFVKTKSIFKLNFGIFTYCVLLAEHLEARACPAKVQTAVVLKKYFIELKVSSFPSVLMLPT